MKMLRLTLCSMAFVLSVACRSKQEALDCFYEKSDIDNDKRISPAELRHSINLYLPWYKRIPFKVFGGVERIWKDCDANGDHYLTQEEADIMKNSCMDSCFKRTMTVSIFNCG